MPRRMMRRRIGVADAFRRLPTMGCRTTQAGPRLGEGRVRVGFIPYFSRLMRDPALAYAYRDAFRAQG